MHDYTCGGFPVYLRNDSERAISRSLQYGGMPQSGCRPPLYSPGKEVKHMANDTDVTQTIKNIIAERLDRKVEELTDGAKFVDDLGADSLDLTELLMALEEEFNVEIDDDANSIETVGDAIEYIKGKLN